MAKRTNQKGQISIFFSASLVVLISMVAFVINVGLFVKAKINLQNSVDAAAFSGAAVQARQLTRIAYLNWEMRNIYKEWMYKYYVLGNLNNGAVSASSSSNDEVTNFAMEDGVNVLTGERAVDHYNFPSVCIHLKTSAAATNICRRFSIQGLPEFGGNTMPGAESSSRALQDVLIGDKVKDCVERSKLNMLVTAMWAYNVIAKDDPNTFGNSGPAIMAHRQGAWPKAAELAMRIRNLEKIVNRETQGPVCVDQGNGINCQNSISSISEESFAGNERIVKAFYSGFRTLGGSYENDEMKNSFTLTELPVTPVENSNPDDPSNLLIPTPYAKSFLDLKLMTVNYATFFTAMIGKADARSSGECGISKVAIPVPGYPLGYYKNPGVVTYYAVKGQANFIGMFNPFNEPIKMTAYAAAKPMGGRIGPKLFSQNTSRNTITRTDSKPAKRRSIPYITSINIFGTEAKLMVENNGVGTWATDVLKEGDYAPGVPIPVNGERDVDKFWLTSADQPVGGRSNDQLGVQFGIPNLPYEYNNTTYSRDGYNNYDQEKLYILSTANNNKGDAVGLWAANQMQKFRGNISSNDVDSQTMEVELARIRLPTAYEAANYLIPSPYDLKEIDGNPISFFGQVTGQSKSVGPYEVYESPIYAPLYYSGGGPAEMLWKSGSEAVSTLTSLIWEQESGVRKYIDSMNHVAKVVAQQAKYATKGASGAQAGYEKAAQAISDYPELKQPDFASIDHREKFPETCGSLAGTFLHFYWAQIAPSNVPGPVQGDPDSCPTPLKIALEKYFASSPNDTGFNSTHYVMEYSYDPSGSFSQDPKLFSAYMPFGATGSPDGVFNNNSNVTLSTRRNFYSTKLIALDSIKASNSGYSDTKNPIYAEGSLEINTDANTKQEAGLQNFLNLSGDDISAVKH